MSPHNYISLFSGAGGLDIGLERCGFAAVSLCEIEPVFCRTLELNKGWTHSDSHSYFEEADIINADIREVSPRDLLRGKDVQLVIGGPPCQAFSSAGKQLSVLDPRGALVSQFCRVIDHIKPKMFLFENVRGIITARGADGTPGGVIRELMGILESLGYSCRAGLLNSADFGSYQRRVRCFIIGTRNGIVPNFPHGGYSRLASEQPNLLFLPWRTLGGFLEHHADKNEGDFVYPTESLARELSQLPNGSGLKSKGRAESTRPGGHWGYRQGTFIADPTLPARTVTGSSSQDWIRWDGKLRRLTLYEVTRLQGFPDDWIISGNNAQRFKQVGNAVPIVFGEVLGGTIRTHLDNYPTGPSVRIPFPVDFEGYITYTKKDHERNKDARQVHLRFKNHKS